MNTNQLNLSYDKIQFFGCVLLENFDQYNDNLQVWSEGFNKSSLLILECCASSLQIYDKREICGLN